ncbi:hypothetical protein LTR70_008871 [Exophiala xenobiotica]|uniref:Uncharacterized protein n=1 Tax=Lithohypha guttulata TaxID=1690604 RepID=A0ABR0K0G9_9EURO|nr:hypothetical protein LTR24_008533 [Lithohypha guttulata]KAK5311335.1 hypothetical protein LTR70_008871 [Exophiala xenobiotica]
MKYFSALLAIGSMAMLSVNAQGVGDAAAAAACQGFSARTLICLTDVHYAFCNGGPGGSVEYPVYPNEHCAQGIVGQQKDAVQQGAATTTRTFALHTAGATSAPKAAA